MFFSRFPMLTSLLIFIYTFSLLFIVDRILSGASQAQFSQMQPMAMASTVAPRGVPMYPPGGPGIGQQIFYGQAPPTIISSQVTSFFSPNKLTRIVVIYL